MSVVSRTNDKPVGLELVGQMSDSAVRTAIADWAPKDDSLLKRVCRSLEAAGLSVVVVVAMEACPTAQPTAHSSMRPRRAPGSAGLSVVTDSAGTDASAELPRVEADLHLMSAPLERYDASRSLGVDVGPEQAPVIVLTAAHNEDAVRAAVGVGGLAYMVKASVPAQDASLLPLPLPQGPRLEEAVGAPAGELTAAPAPGNGLTAREVQVLRAFANGASTIEVAREFFVSPKTVKNHLAHIYAKLGVASRTQAVAKAVRQGIVHIG